VVLKCLWKIWFVLPSVGCCLNTMRQKTEGTSKTTAFPLNARVFFDYDRIELFDEGHSGAEDRFNIIGDTSAGGLTVIGNLSKTSASVDDILFVVYTERQTVDDGGGSVEVTRLISARLATSFERGLYYGKYH